MGKRAATDRSTNAVDVHHGIQQAWDYFSANHGRDGMGGDGKGTRTYVHIGRNYDNAFYSDICKCLAFGDGAAPALPLTSVDVVAHEMTHGVTAATAKLEYGGESGGLNEATSDIFGTLVEFAANNPVDRADYLIGELIKFGGGTCRCATWTTRSRTGTRRPAGFPKLNTLGPARLVRGRQQVLLHAGRRQRHVDLGQQSHLQRCTRRRRDRQRGGGPDLVPRADPLHDLEHQLHGRQAGDVGGGNDLYGAGSAEYAAVNASWNAVGVDGTAPGTASPLAPRIERFDVVDSRVGDVVSRQVVATGSAG